MLHVGLNPYGLTYTVGLQGAGTPRANPHPTGLDGLIALARDVGARCLEIDSRWLLPLADADLAALRARLATAGVPLICSHGLTHEPGETLDAALDCTAGIGASLLRLHLTPVLEGARAAWGARWDAMVAHARATLRQAAAPAAARGLALGIEDHQDFGSEELLAMAEEAGDNVGIVIDTGNPFAVGEDPVAFARRVARRTRHVHLKDYQAQFTDEGYRLVRCAIGDGCVPLAAIAAVLDAEGVSVTASIEPAALEARHVRLFTPDWWERYRPRAARELGVALGRLRRRHLPPDADGRTPWERGDGPEALVDYETAQLWRSVGNLRALGWMSQSD